MAAAVLRINAGDITGNIEDTEPLEVSQLRGDLATEPAISQSHVDDGKVRQVVQAERDRLRDGAADATDLVTVVDENALTHISDHEIVLNYQDLSHKSLPFMRLSPFDVEKHSANGKVRNLLIFECVVAVRFAQEIGLLGTIEDWSGALGIAPVEGCYRGDTLPSLPRGFMWRHVPTPQC